MKLDQDEQVPSYEQIFREESEDESEAEEEGRRFDESSLLRRRERRAWEEERHSVLFSYQRDSYYSSSSATAMYELAWRLSRDNNDLLWWAIVGHTELFLNKKIEDDR